MHAVASVVSLCKPMGCSPPCSSVHGDSPGKNTGVCCHALLQGIFPHPGIELVSHSPALAGGFFTTSTTGSRTIIIFLRPELCSYLVTESCPTLCDPTSLLCLWDFPGENSGVGCHFLLQEIFPIQGSNLSLLHWQMDSLPSPWGSPKAKIPPSNFPY